MNLDIHNTSGICDFDDWNCKNKARFVIGFRGVNGTVCKKHVEYFRKFKGSNYTIRSLEEYKKYQDRYEKQYRIWEQKQLENLPGNI